MTVITRFAPSPTGFLHIGNARTGLFSWLYARHTGGKFLLRIEDTDKERSTPEAVEAIIESMKWLKLDWDGEIVMQSQRAQRHREVANQLLQMGRAYYCYCSQGEIEQFRISHPNQKFRSPWRESKAVPPKGVAPIIRLKAEVEGVSTVEDGVRGKVTLQNQELDDMVLLRSDGSPTYMLAVVVDDYDMGVNQIIRGDDHFTNTFRQKQIIDALGWPVPKYAHIPLIHGSDGAKLSKRHGALGVLSYKEMGYLPQALCNYLLRLGWSNGDDEILSIEESIKLFDITGLGKSPSRFDIEKLNHINAHYISHSTDDELVKLVAQKINIEPDSIYQKRILNGMPGLKVRAKTINDLAIGAKIYIEKSELDEKSIKILKEMDTSMPTILAGIVDSITTWNKQSIEGACIAFAQVTSMKPSSMAQILRALVIGTFAAPGVYEVMEVLGKEETIKRIKQYNCSVR